MYIAFDTFHPLRISMHLVQHQSSIVFVGVDSNVKFSFSFLKLNPYYLVKKTLMAIVFIKVEMFDHGHWFINNYCPNGINTILRKLCTSNSTI